MSETRRKTREMLCLKHFIDIRGIDLMIWWVLEMSMIEQSAENLTSILRSSFLREARESVIMLNQPKEEIFASLPFLPIPSSSVAMRVKI